MVEQETVDIATGEVRSARWYLLTSLSSRQCGPQELLRLFRNHWGIENRQHHVKDRSWDADVHTLRRLGLGEVFATLVNTGLNALRLEGWFPPRMSLPPDVAALGCRCPCEPKLAPSAQRRPSTASTVEPPDFAIVLIENVQGIAVWAPVFYADCLAGVLHHPVRIGDRHGATLATYTSSSCGTLSRRPRTREYITLPGWNWDAILCSSTDLTGGRRGPCRRHTSVPSHAGHCRCERSPATAKSNRARGFRARSCHRMLLITACYCTLLGICLAKRSQSCRYASY